MSSILNKLPLSLAVAAFGLTAAPIAHSSPITINGTNSYTQNFDGLVAGTWTDDSSISGWYAQKSVTGAVSVVVGNGSSNSGALYSFGTTSATDRALGSVGSGTPGNFAWGVQFQNTGASATIGTVSFTGEQWRNGGVATAQTATLWYKKATSAITALNPGTNNTGWTALTAGDFTSPVFSTTAAALDGNATANKVSISLNAGITLNTGEFLMFRWSDIDHTSSDHGLAIDDFSIAWTTAGGDTTPPALATVNPLSPADNATSIAITTPLSVTFSENIAAGTGAITLYKASDDSVVQAFTVGTGGTVSISGATATFTPTSALANNTDYYVLIPSGVITDAAAVPNAFAGISDKTVWNFKTIPSDVTQPTIVSVTPTTASSSIAPPTALTVTFSENVQTPLFPGPSIYVKKVSDDSTVATIDSSATGPVSVVGAVATIPIPANALDYGVSYYIQIDSGAFEDVSTSNNQFAGLPQYSDAPTNTVLSWTFTTVNVPNLATTYSQDFSTYTSGSTLPLGWSFSGGGGFSSIYLGDWGTIPANATPGGFTGNASVFGYQHNSLTNTSVSPLLQTLTLRNNTGALLTNLSIAYKGRMTVSANSRLPVYTVSIVSPSPIDPAPATVTVTPDALAYSTVDGDNAQRNVSLSGLAIPDGVTFRISWSSAYPSGAGSARQIGISDVSVVAGSTAVYTPTVAGLAIPAASVGGTVADVQANVISDGGQALTAKGFVYAVSSINSAPTLGGTGTTTVSDAATTTGAYSATLTGLAAGTTYAVSAYATNASGTFYSNPLTFTTLATPPSLVSSYTQTFTGFNNTLAFPAGWTALSSGGIQSYGVDWGSTQSNGGFAGNDTVNPGVLGYRHTGSTLNLTVTLRMINNSGTTLNSLYVSYKGRVADTAQTRFPAWAVKVNGVVAPSLAYSTGPGVDTTLTDTITGLSIAPGAEFTISWDSDRGTNAGGSSRKIGISNVLVAIPSAPVLASSSASAITSSSATLNGSISSDGYSPITIRGFVYAPTATNSDPLIGGMGVINEVEGGTTSGAFTKGLTGLSASTGYSLKAYATNALGTTYSTVATFSTSAPGLTYNDWKAANANGEAADVDTDGDGIDNGVEFFMGTSGIVFTANPGIVGNVVTWPRASGTTISSFKVEVSTDLNTWTNSTVSYSANLSISPTQVAFTLPTTPGPFFVRLSVTP